MNLTKEKILYIFLCVYVLAWSFCQFLRNQISIDSMEAICWGELVDFGTNKHPPLSGWIMSALYNLFGQNEHVAYFLGSICIAIGLIFVYKLGKFFLTEEKAICAALIMTACYYFTFTLFIDNFNCNFLSIPLWAMIGYFYYKSVKENRLKDWILFGVTSGLAVITKYQVAFLFLALFIHFLWFERKYFKEKGLYLAVLTGAFVALPHIIWLFRNDFFSFAYMANQAEVGPVTSTAFSLKRLFIPVKFIFDQLFAVLPCVAVYLLVALGAKNIKIAKFTENLSDSVFLLSISVVPVLALGLLGLFTGGYIHGIWGSIMLTFTGLALFYFFPVDFKEKSFGFCVKTVSVFMFIWLVIMVIFGLLQVKYKIAYPHQTNIEAFHTIWNEKTDNAPLKYVGGHIDYIFQFRIYDKTRPHVILETFGHKNPWENHEDIINSGALIFAKDADKLEKTVRETVILLPADYKITPETFEYEVKNKFGKTKKFTLYYTIIPPIANYNR